MSISEITYSGCVALAVRLGRYYIRYSPIGLFKPLLWKWLRWRSFQYVARTSFGAKMTGNSLDIVQGHIYYFGLWEPNLTDFISSRLSNQVSRSFVDVGANVGYFTLLAAKIMPKGAVVSIEAFPAIYEKLKKNIALNQFDNIRALPYAATHIECDIEIFHAGALNEGATTTVPGKFNTKPIYVKGKPLSALLTEDEARSMRIMKIDVEGAEHSVLQGLQSIFEKFPDDAEIVVEITPATLGETRMVSIFDMFKAAGFNPYVLENNYSDAYYMSSRKKSHPTRLKSMPIEQTDVVFSKTDADRL